MGLRNNLSFMYNCILAFCFSVCWMGPGQQTELELWVTKPPGSLADLMGLETLSLQV